MSSVTETIVIHGGAWAIPDDLVAGSLNGVANAAKEGYKVLAGGGSALDAVEAAVRSLEDDPVFDAGVGSVLNMAGEVELDAIIMDGRDLRFGSIACVQNIRHPVTLARKVMECTDHTMLVGKGANEFAKEVKIQEATKEELVTPEALKQYEEYSEYKTTVNSLFSNNLSSDNSHDTVGAVALDSDGNVACATSTGGITRKRVGRVGDAPIVGSGAYCDNNVGAVSTTGHGESIMKVTLSRLVLQHIEQGSTAQAAVEKALHYMKDRVGGTGGLIAVSHQGDIGRYFTTKKMAWASVTNKELNCGIEQDPLITEKL